MLSIIKIVIIFYRIALSSYILVYKVSLVHIGLTMNSFIVVGDVIMIPNQNQEIQAHKKWLRMRSKREVQLQELKPTTIDKQVHT